MRRSPEKRGRDVAQKNHTSTRCGNLRRASPKARRRRSTLSTHLVFTLMSIQRTRVCTSPLYDLSFSRMRRVPRAPYTFSPSVLARMRCAHLSTKSPEGLPKKTHRKGPRRPPPAFLRQACGLVETPSARWPEGTGLLFCPSPFARIGLEPSAAAPGERYGAARPVRAHLVRFRALENVGAGKLPELSGRPLSSIHPLKTRRSDALLTYFCVS